VTVYDMRPQFGRFLEDFQAGDVYKHWPGKTITDMDDHLFTLITMNHHPIHIDANYASQTQHGKILVVGTLVLSLVVGLTVKDTSGMAIANLEYESVKHDGPVFIGDTIYAESEVLEVRESQSRPDRGIVYVEVRGFNQRGEKIMTMRRRFLVPKRSAKVVDVPGRPI
jgi:acyl dehydratase